MAVCRLECGALWLSDHIVNGNPTTTGVLRLQVMDTTFERTVVGATNAAMMRRAQQANANGHRRPPDLASTLRRPGGGM